MTDQITFQDPEPYKVPSTGSLLEFDGQVYEVRKTNTHVGLERDPESREQRTLEVRIQAIWDEAGYQSPEMGELL